MSFHSSKTMTSFEEAIEKMPSDPAKMGSFISGLFARQNDKEDQIARIKAEAKISDYEAAAAREFGLVRPAMRSANSWRKEFRRNAYEASVGWAQLMVIAEASGWNKPVEKPEDETPVMDRTKTAQRLRGMTSAFARDGSIASYGQTKATARQQEVEMSHAKCLEKLRSGVRPDRLREGEKAGRPSAAWEEGRMLALQQFEAEGGVAGDGE